MTEQRPSNSSGLHYSLEYPYPTSNSLHGNGRFTSSKERAAQQNKKGLIRPVRGFHQYAMFGDIIPRDFYAAMLISTNSLYDNEITSIVAGISSCKTVERVPRDAWWRGPNGEHRQGCI